MMGYLKKISIGILCIMCANNPFASNACDISGSWFARIYKVTFTFTQESETIKGTVDIKEPVCGLLVFTGKINDHQINLNGHYENQTLPSCDYKPTIYGVLSENCDEIKGKMTSEFEQHDLHLSRPPVKITSPIVNSEFYLPVEPKMPTFKATAEVASSAHLNNLPLHNEDPFSWKIKLSHNLPTGTTHGELNEFITKEGRYETDFSELNSLLGGDLTLTVQYYHSVKDEKHYVVKGTNPGKALIESHIENSILQHIACAESSYRQFKGNREGGVGFPVIGKNPSGNEVGGVGIFQAWDPLPKDYEVWDWRANITYGVNLFAAKKENVRKTMAAMELKRLNKERKQMGLSLCKPGSIPSLNDEQTDRETLRRYNGCREYHWEPRDGKNCEGKWVDNPQIWEHCFPEYVENVLNCSI